ncbi:MAG: hypothetical protein IT319_21310 [Anaerolineae bacterium]|nr:hypothetical protein [Anaerolineae bacterium]
MLKGFLCAGVLLAACAAPPTQRFALGDVILQADFSQPTQWESYVNADQNVNFRIEDGAYRAQAWDGGFMWTIHEPMVSDVVIEVEATQLSEYRNNAYGVMCRASPSANGNGYYFLISGDGQYTIRRGAVDEVRALIPFTASDAIRQDRGINRIRAVCIGTYLALYVNDTFVAETRDDYYRQGYTGLTAAVVDDGDVDIAFDDLKVWSASLLP